MTTNRQGPLSHFDGEGRAVMVDVGAKAQTRRLAQAAGSISMSRLAYDLVKSGSVEKGDVLGVARIAGIMAAKQVAGLIPLTHPLMIDNAEIEFHFNDEAASIEIRATVGTNGKTGVEMEALTAVSIAGLTIYDMCKAVDKSMVITDIRLIAKSGGKSGAYRRGDTPGPTTAASSSEQEE